MSVCAVMLVKDEADIIEATVRHLATQVDALVVADNDSSDGTAGIIFAVANELDFPIFLTLDDEPAYWQSKKMTDLAAGAREFGYDWGIFVDADEMWVSEDGRPIRDLLAGLGADVGYVWGEIYHYVPTSTDPPTGTPFERIGWRIAAPADIVKVGARLVHDLVVEAGNHGVLLEREDRSPVRPFGVGGLRVNHYSWRSETQYARKIVNGARAYALTDLPESVGPHWRMWGDPAAPDLSERAAEHFRRYFFAEDPPRAPVEGDPDLEYDPAVVA